MRVSCAALFCLYDRECSGQGRRTGIGESGRDAESRSIRASKAIGYGGRSLRKDVVSILGACEGGGGKSYTHDGKERAKELYIIL